MEIKFHKYHGTGNDFIIIDSRSINEDFFDTPKVKSLCDRHFGVGADGLILLLSSKDGDFHMKYFNSDGKEGTMCGNGGRCISAFAKRKGLIEGEANFSGIDGQHKACVNDDNTISLKMINVTSVKALKDGDLIETGSRHFVQHHENIENIDVYREGGKIRHEHRFGSEGTNVNFIKPTDLGINIRTFERGVENETLSCGTGAVAAAISAYHIQPTDKISYKVFTRGGELEVKFTPNSDGSFSDVWLKGPAEYVFEGRIDL